MTTGHIRPKVRKAAKARTDAAAAPGPPPIQDDQAVENVRVKMERWVGVGDNGNSSKQEGGPPMKEIVVSTEGSVAPPVTPKATTTLEIATPIANDTAGGISEDAPMRDAQNETKSTLAAKPKNLKSILKTPKYSNNPQPVVKEPKILYSDREEVIIPEPKKKASVFKQGRITERDPTVVPSHPQFNPPDKSSAMAVEGYEPVMDYNKRISTQKPNTKPTISNKPSDDNNIDEGNTTSSKEEKQQEEEKEEPLVFNSIADMMEAAGTLPSQNLQSAQVVEADLAFSCMTQEDFQKGLILQGMEQQEMEQEKQQQSNPKKVEWDTPHSLDQVGYTGTDPVNDGNEDDTTMDGYDSEDDGEGLFDLLGLGDDESEEEQPPAKPRAFRILWDCLAPLVTHQSIIYMKRIQRIHESGSGDNLISATPMYDIEASRSSGFMAMVRMYMSRCLAELGQRTEMKRMAEQRLQGLVYTFNFSRPAAKLDTKHWKALTCILIEILLFLDHADNPARPQLPRSAEAVQMTLEEYQYLVKNTIKLFDIPDPVI
ncbi:expressed unknown protein [Seminavis robusta]|uniref:Uncharacterized protein n=1 Tax=Seminavis robusta TaxID=568900 RepID=A0A9N8E5E8_9STRA|nr:expressed unknown protein [Seminavis robusta]|eukprot:Sro691_g187900.1 n/a (542) ;mRNA; r:35775-37400